MIRALLVALTHLVIVPVLGTIALIAHVIRPQWLLAHRFSHFWGRAVMRAAGVRFRVEGLETLERCRPAVVVANHSSNFDVYALCSIMPIPYMIPAKQSLFRIPIVGAAMRSMGMVPLERSGTKRDWAQIERLARGFECGGLLLFFPEGTRVEDGRLRPFRKSAFVVAIKHQVPVIPVAIIGAHRIQRRRAWRIRPGELVVRVLEPIPTRGLTYDDRDVLRDRAWQAVRNALPPDQRPPEDGGGTDRRSAR